MQEELTLLVEQETSINETEQLAVTLDLPQLAASVSCARGELEASKANLMASLGPLNKLLDFIRALVALLPVPIEIPTLDNLGDNAQDILATLGTLADVLEQIAGLIPG